VTVGPSPCHVFQVEENSTIVPPLKSLYLAQCDKASLCDLRGITGDGIETMVSLFKKEPEGIKLLKKAAEQGDAESQRRLGFYYEKGIDVPVDFKKAVHWYTKAAEQDDTEAQELLSFCYYAGRGVERDLARSKEWTRRAAELGSASAQCQLVCNYRMGIGVPMDYTQAKFWLSKAAEQGSAEAQQKMKEYGWA